MMTLTERQHADAAASLTAAELDAQAYDWTLSADANAAAQNEIGRRHRATRTATDIQRARRADRHAMRGNCAEQVW